MSISIKKEFKNVAMSYGTLRIKDESVVIIKLKNNNWITKPNISLILKPSKDDIIYIKHKQKIKKSEYIARSIAYNPSLLYFGYKFENVLNDAYKISNLYLESEIYIKMNANSKLRWSFSTDNIVIDCDICIDTNSTKYDQIDCINYHNLNTNNELYSSTESYSDISNNCCNMCDNCCDMSNNYCDITDMSNNYCDMSESYYDILKIIDMSENYCDMSENYCDMSENYCDMSDDNIDIYNNIKMIDRNNFYKYENKNLLNILYNTNLENVKLYDINNKYNYKINFNRVLNEMNNKNTKKIIINILKCVMNN